MLHGGCIHPSPAESLQNHLDTKRKDATYRGRRVSYRRLGIRYEFIAQHGEYLIFYNNHKWGITFKTCESPYGTLETYVILYTNHNSIEKKMLNTSSFQRTVLFIVFQCPCLFLFTCLNSLLRSSKSQKLDCLPLFFVFAPAISSHQHLLTCSPFRSRPTSCLSNDLNVT